ncbi:MULTISPECIES: RHS repeat-associated core domain-containing protein [unclassified Pseudomonas]|uniref:RHS repeat-associated core domain-containing protein n=1 Tax=Pseudomonas sp. MYb327 TaxID=2745230 RepID=A0AAU8E7T0_9PSED
MQFHRRLALDPIEPRVTRQRFDAAARPVASRDPYLFALALSDASAPDNLSQVLSLSGAALSSDSVDAGWRLALHGAAGQVVDHWDGRGSHSWTEFDDLLRPVAVRESGDGMVEHVLERFTYADADAITGNLCGQLIRHDDPAGTVHLRELGLGGAVLQQTRHFLRDTDGVNWPSDASARDALLEPGAGATTAYSYAPSTELLQQIDALGNRQRFAYTVAGELSTTYLTLAGAGQSDKPLVSEILYNPSGQIESETAGNGVITRHRYDLADGRLIGLSAHKANGTPLQDLNYRYDAAGNVLSIEDAAQPIRYFNNQRIEPIKTYRYDTLGQLIEATGWEAKTGNGGPALPGTQPLPLDPNQIANYVQTFHYDAGGNLLNLVHVGAQTHGRTLTRTQYSNRCLPERNGRPPTEAELADGFDANGNLRELQVGQSLDWDLRNQLTRVRPVVREDGNDDYEKYLYDGSGQRVRKIRANQTNVRTLISEVRYLPGVEIRTHSGTGEILHVINASAGSNGVQVLHWVAQKPGDITNDQVRYSLNDHLKSSTMELDQNADLISQEWYYPFGGTACFAARSATEAKYKTVRYSGKERDATGLYYYGFRYYAPWLQRWINPDPAGYVDGMNLYAMVGNRPINFADLDGRMGTELTAADISHIVNTLKRDMGELPQEDVRSVVNQYLKGKGANPQQYSATIMSKLGFASEAIAEPQETTYHRRLTSNEKKGLHLFWSTNAGSRYIGATSRNFFIRANTQERPSLATASNEARRELKSNTGEYSVNMSNDVYKSSFVPALQLLSEHEQDPWQTILLMSASVGPKTSSPVYRGSRLSDMGLSLGVSPTLKIGDIVSASSFLSFSSDKTEAESFISKYHHDNFIKGTVGVIFVASDTYTISNSIEHESIVFPATNYIVKNIVTQTTSGNSLFQTTRKFTPMIYLEKTNNNPPSRTKWI